MKHIVTISGNDFLAVAVDSMLAALAPIGTATLVPSDEETTTFVVEHDLDPDVASRRITAAIRGTIGFRATFTVTTAGEEFAAPTGSEWENVITAFFLGSSSIESVRPTKDGTWLVLREEDDSFHPDVDDVRDELVAMGIRTFAIEREEKNGPVYDLFAPFLRVPEKARS